MSLLFTLGSEIYKAATLAFRKSIHHDWNNPAETTIVSLFIPRSQYISHMMYSNTLRKEAISISTQRNDILFFPLFSLSLFFFYPNTRLSPWCSSAQQWKEENKVLWGIVDGTARFIQLVTPCHCLDSLGSLSGSQHRFHLRKMWMIMTNLSVEGNVLWIIYWNGARHASVRTRDGAAWSQAPFVISQSPNDYIYISLKQNMNNLCGPVTLGSW